MKVCLILDNPLRDLNGLVLLAYEFAKAGHECWITPMYEQAFDIAAIKPDWVVLNYIRKNNLDIVIQYISTGIRVAVLDTEGAAGKSADEFAALVASSGGAGLADLYCAWGPSQAEALERTGCVAQEAIVITGCPRYDFCAMPWKKTLFLPDIEPGFILVNTNFPTVNPRFSDGVLSERKTFLSVGAKAEFVDSFLSASKNALSGMTEIIRELSIRFPEKIFILRPHPFENRFFYDKILSSRDNVIVRQEGTSLEWLSACDALIHINCSTAIEAAMLDKPALSPGWIDHEATHLPNASRLSFVQATKDELEQLLCDVGCLRPASETFPDAYSEIIAASYSNIDGKASSRVVRALELRNEELAGSRRDTLPLLSLRAKFLARLRLILGPNLFRRISGIFRRLIGHPSRNAKNIDVMLVKSLLDRFQKVSPVPFSIEVSDVSSHLRRPRLFSGSSVLVAMRKNKY